MVRYVPLCRITPCLANWNVILLVPGRKEALAAKKAQGQILGKPRGTIQKSKFDAHQEKIKELLGIGLSVRKITKVLGYSNHIALNEYLNKRQLKS